MTVPVVTSIGPKTWRVVWANMATGVAPVPHLVAGLAARATVQASGTFNLGTVIGLTGSVDGSVYAVLTDLANAAISGRTAAFLAGVGPGVTAFAPTIGSGSADNVTVTLVYEVF